MLPSMEIRTNVWTPLARKVTKEVVTLYQPPVEQLYSPETLVAGCKYWLRDKETQELQIGECYASDGNNYFTRNRIWATVENNQAFQRWDIYGPLPEFVFNPV